MVVSGLDKKKRAAKPVGWVIAARSTGIKRPDVRFAHDGMLAVLATGFYLSWPRATLVLGRRRSLHRSARRAIFRCNRGAKAVERMGVMLVMDFGYITHVIW